MKVGNLASNIESSLKFAAVNFLLMCGKIVDSINDEVTHVVLHSSDLSNVNELKSQNQERAKKFFLVNENWIMESWNKRSCLDENLFLL